MSPSDTVFYHEDSVNLTCSSEGGPGNTFQWAFNGSNIQSEVSSNLHLSFITANDDGGAYTCVVSNAAGSGSSTTSVFVYPFITLNPENATAAIGDSAVSFLCAASAFPFPVFAWFGAGEGIVSFDNNTSVMTVITLAEGEYYCTATSNNMTVQSETAILFGMIVCTVD